MVAPSPGDFAEVSICQPVVRSCRAQRKGLAEGDWGEAVDGDSENEREARRKKASVAAGADTKHRDAKSAMPAVRNVGRGRRFIGAHVRGMDGGCQRGVGV